MKLTKFEHACFTLEKDDQTLLFDPGSYTSDLVIPGNVIAVVLTHEHADHFDKDLLQQVIDKNPGARILAPQDMAEQLPDAPTEVIAPGGSTSVGSFSLRFFGGEHAVVHPEIANVANVGVLVSDSFYYPGDSFDLPDVPVQTLALPVTAPWLKISESIDFMRELKPRLAFPVHDHIASSEGKAAVDRHLSNFAGKDSITYRRISGTIDID